MRLVPDQCNGTNAARSGRRLNAGIRSTHHLGALVVAAGRRAVVGKVRGAGAIEEAAGRFNWDGSSGHIGLDLQIRGSPWFEEIKGGVADGWLRFCDDGDVLQLAHRTALAISLERYESELQTISPPEMVMSHDSFVNISPECHSGALWVATSGHI